MQHFPPTSNHQKEDEGELTLQGVGDEPHVQ